MITLSNPPHLTSSRAFRGVLSAPLHTIGIALVMASHLACGTVVGPADADAGPQDTSPITDATTTDAPVATDVPDGSDSSGANDVLLLGTMLERFEGRTVYARLEAGGTNFAVQTSVVSGGRVEFRWPDARCTQCFGYGIAVYVDEDADMRCTTETVYFVTEGLPDRTTLSFTASSSEVGPRDCTSFN